MPNLDHLPDLAHAPAWLEELRKDLLAARSLIASGDALPRQLVETFEAHATTLGDVIARGEVIPKLPERAHELLATDVLNAHDTFELGGLVHKAAKRVPPDHNPDLNGQDVGNVQRILNLLVQGECTGHLIITDGGIHVGHDTRACPIHDV